MAQDRAKQLLQQGISAAKAGQKDQARQILQQAVRLAPQNETIWLWLSSVARDNKERIFCLKQLLEINPKNEHALKGLQALGVAPAEVQEPVASVPQMTQEKLNKIQENIDEFLQEYSAEPHTVLDVEWVRKPKNRYLENAARKLRRTRNAIYSGVAAVFVTFCLFLTITLDIPGQLAEDTPTPFVASTLQSTVTSTVTVTPTIGSSPTPSPTPRATATDVPLAGENLVAGDIFPTATNIYPDFSSDVRASMGTAVYAYDRENYEVVHDISSARRESLGSTGCYPELYYYDARALANEGNYAEANTLLLEGLTSGNCQGQTTKEAFIYLGMCIVRFEEATIGRRPENYDVEALLRTGQADFLANGALELCGAASDGDFGLFEALDYTAKIDLAVAEWALANEDFDEFVFRLNLAADLIDERALGLEGAGSVGRFRTNISLLLTRADVELLRGEPHDALSYIYTALYLIPTDENALRKNVEAFELIAQQTEDDPTTEGVDEKLLRYGEMALQAETYVNYYPGKAIGYALLARARYAEGSPDRALSAVNRVIASADDLPSIEREGIIESYAIRAQIYMDQQNWTAALVDLDELSELEPNNPNWPVLKTTVALELGDFDIVQENIAAGLAADPENPLFILAQARLDSVTCQYTNAISCNPEAVFEVFTPEFLETLTPEQQQEAAYYQARAQYELVVSDDTLTQNQINAQLTPLIAQTTALVAENPTAESYYFLGQLYETTEQPEQALRTYQWVNFWQDEFDYPFGDDLTNRIDEIEEAIAEANEA